MARKSINELIAQANADFPDNATGLITPAKLRQFCVDFLNTMSPTYGYLTAAGPVSQTINTTWALLAVFDTAYDSDPSQTTANATTDTITRAEKGSSTFQFSIDFACANNVSMHFALYKNGTITSWRISGVGRGAGNPVSVALTAVDYADPAASYQIWASAENAGTAGTFSAAAFLLSVEPVKSFT